MIVVPSFLPRTGDEAVDVLSGLARRTTPVEIRIDGLRRLRPRTLETILAGPRPPVIVTCRAAAEGGLFRGPRSGSAALLAAAIRAGAEFIDVERSIGRRLLERLISVAGRERIILSLHDPARTPRNLAARFRALSSYRPFCVKIAVNARTFADTARVLDVLDLARTSRQKAAAFAMGEFGVYTRVLQGPLGGAMTFGSHGRSLPTAPGQPSVIELEQRYRAAALDRRTKIFGLLGYPVSFSEGTAFHNLAFRRHRRNAVYVNFASDDAGDFMRILGGRIAGLSVTMPFKASIVPLLDVLEGSALLTGSVNTVIRKSGRLTGLNTDFHAFLRLLRRLGGRKGRTMLILGTGATAATAAAAGVLSGARVTIAGRDLRRARAVAERFGCAWIGLPDQPRCAADVLVNATPVGMDPGARGGRRPRIVAPGSLRNYGAVCDFANPPGQTTALVDDAVKAGLRVVTGRQIFRAQAGIQSALFLEIA